VVDRQQHARRPGVWRGCPTLTCVVVGDGCPKDQPDTVRDGFTDRTRATSTTSTISPMVKATV
jgi:hypothetical protein